MNRQHLTVDAGAHLRKLASNYYRSEVLNIIELIRSSLKRGGSKVKLRLDKRTIIIEDNGSGISKEQIVKLKNIADLNRSQMEREDEILSFIKEYGIDILVIFSFLPLDIKIENNCNNEEDKIFIKETGLFSEKNKSVQSGTKIIIKRKCEDLKIENRIITEYCRNIGDKIEINGKPVIKRTIIQNMIISVNTSKTTDDKSIEIGIAKIGSLCKLWTLNAGIPISVKTFPDINGYIFEIVKGIASTDTTKELSKFAEKLYFHLVNNYNLYPKEIKQRIKELIYKHYKITTNPLFINKLNSFNIIGNIKGISVDQLKNIAKNKKIYGVLDRKELKGTDTIGKIILLLDQLDIDLLVNSFNFNIIFLQHQSNKIHIKEKFIFKLIKIIKTLISKRMLNRKKHFSLSENEIIFIREIDSYLSKNEHFKALYPQSKGIKVKLVSQKLLVPAITTISDEYINIFISKRHKRVKKAIELYKSDKRDLEWLLPQIIY